MLLMMITKPMLAGAAVRALRQWLFELGHKNPTIGSAGDGLPGVYHLLNVGRLVQVRTAIAPSYPECLSANQIRVLCALARRLDAQPWEAQIIVRPNFHPSAIAWRCLEQACQRTLAAWPGRYGVRTAFAGGCW